MIKIKNDYGNGSYAYWSEKKKQWHNIPVELGQAILAEQKDHKKELILQHIFDTDEFNILD